MANRDGHIAKFLFLSLVAGMSVCAYLTLVHDEFLAQEKTAERYTTSNNTSVMIAWQQPMRANLHGTDLAHDAVGHLQYSGYDPIATLKITDLPVLPPNKTYQLWCYDIAGVADASTSFTVAIDEDGPISVHAVAPRTFGTYLHFSISIETGPANTPSREIVMTD